MREKTVNMICEAVAEKMGSGFSVTHQKMQKNNDLTLNALVIRESGTMISPVIYVDVIADRLEEEEIGMQEAVHEIVDIYKKNRDTEPLFQVVKALSKEYILSNVFYQLVNKEKNKSWLMEMPHVNTLDLAATYRVTAGEDSAFGIPVSHALCCKYDIGIEELDAAARRNTEAEGFTVLSMKSVLQEVVGNPLDFKDEFPMFVLTNPAKMNGAAVMLYSRYFDKLAQKLNRDLYVLPSSIHEIIAIPDEDVIPDNLRNMVAEINEQLLAHEEVLSNNVYRYSREKGVLEIA